MPAYGVKFQRTVTQVDTLERVIWADTAEKAQEIADQLGSDFDECCPDDYVSESGDSCGSWSADFVVGPVPLPADYRATADGYEEVE